MSGAVVIGEVKATYTDVFYVCPVCRHQARDELTLASVVGAEGMSCCRLIFPTNCPECDARLDVEFLSAESIV